MKFRRQNAIMEIINRFDVKTQEELSDRLSQMGFTTTQATISRDIKELRIIKVSSPTGGYKYAAPEAHNDANFIPRLKNIFKECVTSIDMAQNLVVIKTLNGMANAAAYAIDTMKKDNIVGTLAGDDTILVILRDEKDADQFCQTAKDMLK